MHIFPQKSLKIPPPVVTAIFGLLMYGLNSIVTLVIAIPLQCSIIILLSLLAFLLLLPAVFQFYQNKTTVNPLNPEKASKLVVSGLYRFSRNPMYLGMALLLLSWGVYLGNPLNILVFLVFIAYMNHFQIRLEEEALAQRFGDEFLEYKTKVRRWL